MSTQLSIVIPVYRSQESLRTVHEDLTVTLSQQGYEYEIVFIEDGGGDNSWQVICELAQSDQRVKGIKLSKNYGQHNAILCGINNSSGDIIITMDDDGQHPANQIPLILTGLTDEYDVVYATPNKLSHSVIRNFASWITKRVLARSMSVESAESFSAFRAIRRSVTSGFSNFNNPTVNIDVMLTWATSRFGAVAVEHRPRMVGESGYTLTALINHSLNMVTGFSILPLRIASYLGFSFAFFGFLALAYILINFLISGSVVPGFAFIGSLISIFSGVQLLTLGIIGEYVGRIHQNGVGQPSYLIAKSTSG